MYLVVDIGGTNYNIAIIKDLSKNEFVIHEKANHDSFSSLSEIIFQFLKKNNLKTKDITAIVCSIAGPRDNNFILTNDALEIDLNKVRDSFKEVFFLNDFEAIGYGVDTLKEEDIENLFQISTKKERKVVVGPGTGLGVVIFFESSRGTQVRSSEGAQIEFAPRTHEEFQFLLFLQKELNEEIIVYDEILSGTGLELIYKYLQTTLFHNEISNLSAEQISKTRHNNICSKESFNRFYSYLARFCKSIVLETLTFGGLYLAGGVVQKNLDILDRELFIKEFTTNNSFSNLLKETPISVIKNYNVNLYGNLQFLREQFLEK